MAFHLYQKRGLFAPDKWEEHGKRKLPKYSDRKVKEIIEVIKNMRNERAMRSVQANAHKLESI